jgi:hypothetical protein
MQRYETHQWLPKPGARFRSLALALISAGLLGGCTVETVYTRVQHEDGLAMKAPIAFTVRIQLDPASKVVTWMQDAEDALGVTDRQISTYGDDPGSTCEVFDDKNWKCEFRGTDGTVLEKPEMKDGDLSRFYWTNTEKYQRQWRLFNHNF